MQVRLVDELGDAAAGRLDQSSSCSCSKAAVFVVPMVALNASVTCFATVFGPSMLGLPSSSMVNLALLSPCLILTVGDG